MTSSEKEWRGSGSFSQAWPMRRASSSESMRGETPLTSRDALQFLGGLRHGVEGIHTRRHQQFDRLTFFLGYGNHTRE